MTAPEHTRSPEPDPPGRPRRAVPAEVPAITALVRAAYAHYVPRIGVEPFPMIDDYARRVEHDEAWVLDDDGEIVGVLMLVPAADHLLIDNVAVRTDRQGHGLGRVLLSFAEEQAREAGVHELRLYTNVRMTENRALYAHVGYVELDQETVEGRHRVWMRKRL
jgi:N-acetylglutamate synthase-like GNAT family acetyltransferase